MLNLVIFGAPGSGKGTQSAKLIDEYGLFHISTGEVLRAQIAQGTELGKVADSYISKGQLIPDELMIQILDDVLEQNAADVKGVVFDGFPRTIPQAEALKGLLEKRGTDLHAVIGLEVPEDELVDRMIKRGQQTGRADDNIDTIKNRLEENDLLANTAADCHNITGAIIDNGDRRLELLTASGLRDL
ncbi:MAG: adenylate kinase, partial [Muribaculaceae bacterium]|nr:adenylate kinase [Muribaculaceae bacterium]